MISPYWGMFPYCDTLGSSSYRHNFIFVVRRPRYMGLQWAILRLILRFYD